MAVTLNTNSGFVSTAPTADPAGSADVVSDGASVVTKDTAPAGATRIIEVGWYKASGTTSSNTQVGLYAADGATVPGEAGTRLQVTADQASGTLAGWIVFTGLSWTITGGTVYWLGMQQDAHTGSSNIDSSTTGGAGYDRRTSQTALTDPYGGGALDSATGMYAIYALYTSNKYPSVFDGVGVSESVTVSINASPTVSLNTPSDLATGQSLTPTLNFTGTDTEGDTIEYNVQIDTSSTFALVRATSILEWGSTDSGATSFVTSSITPVADRLYIATIHSGLRTTTDPNTPTLTGCGLTWVQIDTILPDDASSSRSRITMFRAMGSSPTAGALTTDHGGQTQDRCTVTVDEFIGVDTSGTNGSGAVVQSAKNRVTGGTSLTVTLAAFGSSSNATYGAFGISYTSTDTVGTGFTELSNAIDAASDYKTMTEFRNDNDTSVDMSFAVTLEDVGAIAIEIRAAPLINKVSTTDAGFTAGHPFASGVAKEYTVQSSLTASTVYYWRVRGKGATGSSAYGAYPTAFSFTTGSGGDDVNVFDAPTVAETVTILQANYVPSVSDSPTVAETVTVSIFNKVVNVFDAPTVAEAVTVNEFNLVPSVFDSVTTAETVTVIEANLIVNVFDSVTASESNTVVPNWAVSVFDSVVVSEFLGYWSDSIYVRESVTVQLGAQSTDVSVFDTVNVSESVTMQERLLPNVFDSVTASESITVFEPTYYPSVSDSVTVAEAITSQIPVYINVFDSITAAENTSIRTASQISVFDSITVAETVTAYSDEKLSVFDSITVSESITAGVNFYEISVIDQVTLADVISNIFVAIQRDISVSDFINVSEDITVRIPILTTSVIDTVLVSEDISLYITELFISVVDSVQTSESISAVTTEEKLISVYDSITISENISINLAWNISVYENIFERDDWCVRINWNYIDPTSASWSEVNPTSSSWSEQTPTASIWTTAGPTTSIWTLVPPTDSDWDEENRC